MGERVYRRYENGNQTRPETLSPPLYRGRYRGGANLDLHRSDDEEEFENEPEYYDGAEADEPVQEPTRRGALGAIIGFGSLAALGTANYAGQAHGENVAQARAHFNRPVELRELSPDAEAFDLGPLAGMHVGGLETDLLGLRSSGKLPLVLPIDYSANQKRMWQKKISIWEPRLEKHGRHIDINVLQMQAERVGEYEMRWKNSRGRKTKEFPEGQQYADRGEAVGRTTLEKATQEINAMLETVKNHLSPQILQETYHLNDEQMRVLGTLAVNIDSSLINAQGMLAAYSMTELLPKWDGKQNALFYDFLLQTGGKEFLANIPSMGDPATSFGVLQFTQKGLEGALVANKALPPELRLPETIDQLHDFVDHFKAGYLFAVNNIATVVKQLEGDELRRFGTIDKKSLLAFMSTSHNNPTLARKSLRKFLAQDADSFMAPSFTDCCKQVDADYAEKLRTTHRRVNAVVKMEDYATKTIRNFEGLQEFLGTQ